jgi:hypothetical protein
MGGGSSRRGEGVGQRDDDAILERLGRERAMPEPREIAARDARALGEIGVRPAEGAADAIHPREESAPLNSCEAHARTPGAEGDFPS